MANEIPKDRLLFLITDHRPPPDDYIISVQAHIIVIQRKVTRVQFLARSFPRHLHQCFSLLQSFGGKMSSAIRLYSVASGFESWIVVEAPTNGNRLFPVGVGGCFLPLIWGRGNKRSCPGVLTNARETGRLNELHICTHRPPRPCYCQRLPLFSCPSPDQAASPRPGG